MQGQGFPARNEWGMEEKMENEILNMINDRKNKDFFVQMHPLKVKLSIEEKIYYLNGIKYLAGENNECAKQS